ncbi:hypothetical protein X736_32560 [Mesorhizobium sp. L2C089B000]|nr:hypothetical protein X736_32560 [Mesorhizobium sp. L2C089B000]
MEVIALLDWLQGEGVSLLGNQLYATKARPEGGFVDSVTAIFQPRFRKSQHAQDWQRKVSF